MVGEGQKRGLYRGADGINGSFRIWKDPNNHAAGSVNVTCGTAPYVCPHGPGYDLFAGKFAKGNNAATYPYAPQSNDHAYANGARDQAIMMFNGSQLPIKRALSEHFGLFNKLYTAVPTCSMPNHMFTQSATSCGVNENEVYDQCGGELPLFPQKTIYDSMVQNNKTIALFNHDLDYPPDAYMDGVLRHALRYQSYDDFYLKAAAGTLPQFSWIAPPEDSCDHPCHVRTVCSRLFCHMLCLVASPPFCCSRVWRSSKV